VPDSADNINLFPTSAPFSRIPNCGHCFQKAKFCELGWWMYISISGGWRESTKSKNGRCIFGEE